MDTDLTPNRSHPASRQTYVTGNAVREAALMLLRCAFWTCSISISTSTPKKFTWTRAEPCRGALLPWQQIFDLLKNSPEGLEPVSVIHAAPPPPTPSRSAGYPRCLVFPPRPSKSPSTPQSGEIIALKVVAAHDVGRVINPLGFQDRSKARHYWHRAWTDGRNSSGRGSHYTAIASPL